MRKNSFNWTVKPLSAGLFLALLCVSCASTKNKTKKIEYHLNAEYDFRKPEGKPVQFTETWGYVSQYYIDEYKPEFPLTDVCLFAADLNCYGEIIDIPQRSKITVPNGVRVHFTMICDGKTLSHVAISPEFGWRDRIIDEIVDLAADFDGVQLDFELIPQRDKDLYFEFVNLLRNKVKAENPEKIFSVCVPARNKISETDIYSYKKLAEICDRIFVMSYDQHWSTSKPGAIADLEWSKQICDFAKTQIPAEKLIMGIPFYGRSWTDKNVAGAWYFARIQKILQDNQIKKIDYENDIPSFEYKTEVNVKTYFNDAYSVHKLCQMYNQNKVDKIGFWRIGHEDPHVWEWIKTNQSATNEE